MLPTREDVDKYERAYEEIKESLRRRLLTPEEYKKLYDKHNLRELTPKVIGWIRICKHCHKIIQPIYGEDLIKMFDCEKCRKIKKENEKCYILKKQCQSISRDDKRCCDLSGSERFIFLQEYIDDMPIRETKEYCSDKCKQVGKSKRWRKDHPKAKMRADLKYLKDLEKYGDLEGEENT